MPERDCSKHQTKVSISLDETKLKNKQHSNLIAALLRQIADYTDGWCATELAYDANLSAGKSMSFYFTSDEKRKIFKNRINIYLADDVSSALTKTDH